MLEILKKIGVSGWLATLNLCDIDSIDTKRQKQWKKKWKNVLKPSWIWKIKIVKNKGFVHIRIIMSRVESDLFVRIGLANLDLQVKMVGFVITIWVKSRDSDLQIWIVIMNLRFVRIQLVYSTKDSWGLIGFVKITWILWKLPRFLISNSNQTFWRPDSWSQFESSLRIHETNPCFYKSRM